MKVIVLVCIFAGALAANISPFVPKEIVKHEVDIARVQYAKEKRDQAQALKLEKAENMKQKPFISAQEEATTEKPKGEVALHIEITVTQFYI